MFNKFRKKVVKKLEDFFPEVHLRKWLQNRKHWNHNDWLVLLEDLRGRGFSQFTDCEEGRTRIGNFLEAEREKVSNN